MSVACTASISVELSALFGCAVVEKVSSVAGVSGEERGNCRCVIVVSGLVTIGSVSF